MLQCNCLSGLDPLRKRLGRTRRWLFRTNDASWYCKVVDKSGSQNSTVSTHSANNTKINNYSTLVAWLRVHCAKYPWIYSRREIEYASTYKHLYSTIDYDSKIAGYVKVGLKKAYIEDYNSCISLEDDEAFIYDTFTLPKLRKNNLATQLLETIFKYLESASVSYIYCHIPDWNIASQTLYKNLGFKKIAHIRYIRVMNRRFFTKNPLAIKKIGRELGCDEK